MSESRPRTNWPGVLRRYLLASLALHAFWEIAQLPLYTIWSTGTVQQRWFAVFHCTLGDVMIAGLALMVALAVLGRASWPDEGSRIVWLATLFLGAGYTIYSEWLNVSVRGTWAYSTLMPKLPIVGTGLSPLLQWIIAPTLSQWYATGRKPWRGR
jgi:hypothetical protein